MEWLIKKPKYMEKIRIYLIARISKDAHSWNNWVTGQLNASKIQVFKPHEHNPWNLEHQSFSKEVFEVDLQAIRDSHLGLCLPEFGNDCSWECGWYSNSHKPLVAFVSNQEQWLKDWMVKGGIDYVITDNCDTYQKLLNDRILGSKNIILLNQIGELSAALENIYTEVYIKKENKNQLTIKV